MIRQINCKTLFLMIALLLISSPILAGGKWYNDYEDGLEAMRRGNWAIAIEKFHSAIKVKPQDTKNIKTYGMHFIDYYPHREMGICLFNLGRHELAKRELNISLRQQFSARAQEYLDKLGGPDAPQPQIVDEPKPLIVTPPEPEREQVIPPPVIPPMSSKPIKLVGERMGIAILPFQSKGLGVEIGEINITEQLMTSFFNCNRFKIFERTQLEQILKEQKLGMTGIIDASTAAEIGKGIGVDAILLGSVTLVAKNLSIDARLIDTETAEIITAQDEMTNTINIQGLRDMIQGVSQKISSDLPLAEGYVINVDGGQLTLDLSSANGIKKGMKCIVYREGQEIIHPITKQVLGKQTEELGQIKLMQVYPQYSIGKVIRSEIGVFEIGNKVVTK